LEEHALERDNSRVLLGYEIPIKKLPRTIIAIMLHQKDRRSAFYNSLDGENGDIRRLVKGPQLAHEIS